MLQMTRAELSRMLRSHVWANRPVEALDNPVKRYLGNRSVGPGLWKRSPRWTFRSDVLRPAF